MERFFFDVFLPFMFVIGMIIIVALMVHPRGVCLAQQVETCA